MEAVDQPKVSSRTIVSHSAFSRFTPRSALITSDLSPAPESANGCTSISDPNISLLFIHEFIDYSNWISGGTSLLQQAPSSGFLRFLFSDSNFPYWLYPWRTTRKIQHCTSRFWQSSPRRSLYKVDPLDQLAFYASIILRDDLGIQFVK